MTREEAIEEINKAFEPAFANYIITALVEGATVSDKALEQEPKTGHWMDEWASEYKTCPIVVCSICKCNGSLSYKDYNYCLNCGARMVEPQERNDKV